MSKALLAACLLGAANAWVAPATTHRVSALAAKRKGFGDDKFSKPKQKTAAKVEKERAASAYDAACDAAWWSLPSAERGDGDTRSASIRCGTVRRCSDSDRPVQRPPRGVGAGASGGRRRPAGACARPADAQAHPK